MATFLCLFVLSSIVASEWKSFMFFYVPAALHGILPDKYYIHVFLLIKAMRIFLGNVITDSGLNLAETLIKMFCSQMEQYYGKSCVVMPTV